MRKQSLPAAIILSAALASAALAETPARNFDAVAAAPDSHQVLLENDKVRVLRVVVAPGAVEPAHEHRWPSVMYFEQPQPIAYIVYELAGGALVEAQRIEAPALPTGEAVWADPEGLHAVENRGSEPFIALRVEFKDGAPATP
jgi:quercetin dioxygenase-like cupin family protein